MSDHLSAHLLERRSLGLLEGERLASADAHLRECEACRGKLGALQSETSSFNQTHDADVFARRVLARVERESEAKAPRFNWGWLVGFLVPAAAAAVLLVSRGPAPTYTGVKGAARLELFAPEGKLADGAMVHPGEAIRFAVGAPRNGYALIVGLNARGELFPYYPLQGEESAPQQAAQQALLPASVVLDSQLGAERFYLLFSDAPIRVADLQAAVRAGHVKLDAKELPMKAEQASVMLEKTP